MEIRNGILCLQVRALKSSVIAMKKRCREVNQEVLEKAISKLTVNEQIAVRSCFKASQCEDSKGMRYTTQWIYECLLLRIKSKKAYEHLRKRRILVLPSISTLSRYMKRIGGSYGFQSNLFKIIAEKCKEMKPDELRGTCVNC